MKEVELFRIKGQSKKDGHERTFEFSSIKECAFHNPNFHNFKIIGQDISLQKTFGLYY